MVDGAAVGAVFVPPDAGGEDGIEATELLWGEVYSQCSRGVDEECAAWSLEGMS